MKLPTMVTAWKEQLGNRNARPLTSDQDDARCRQWQTFNMPCRIESGSVLIHRRTGTCWLALICLLPVFTAGCNRGRLTSSEFDTSRDNTDSTGVAVTTPALFYLANEIADGTVEVFLVGRSNAGNTPWNPDPSAISKMQKANLVIYNGAGFETWLQNITVPARILVDASAIDGVELIPVADFQTHQHGPTGQQSKTACASQVWHDPSILRKQAVLVRDRLILEFPDHADAFRSGYNDVTRELDELKESIEAATREIPSNTIIDPTNSFVYLTRAFHLEPLVSGLDLLEMDFNSESESELTILNDLAARKAVVLLPVGTAYNALQSYLERSHIAVVRLDSLETASNDKAYIDRLRENLSRLAKAISDAAS